MAKAASEKMARKNLIVNESQIKQLRRVLGVQTESEAVRIAVSRALHTRQALTALRRMRARGTIADVYRRAQVRKSH